jgi:hypothetical protein
MQPSLPCKTHSLHIEYTDYIQRAPVLIQGRPKYISYITDTCNQDMACTVSDGEQREGHSQHASKRETKPSSGQVAG